jgi:hypothetical protein
VAGSFRVCTHDTCFSASIYPDGYSGNVIGLLLLAVVAAVLAAAALNDLYWRRKGFRTVVRGRGKHREVLRIALDGSTREPEAEPTQEYFPPVPPGREWRPRNAPPDDQP